MVLDQNVLAAMDEKCCESDTFSLEQLKAEESVEYHHTEGFNPYFKIRGHNAKFQCGPSIRTALESGKSIEDLESSIFFTLCTFYDGTQGYKAALGQEQSKHHEVVLF